MLPATLVDSLETLLVLVARQRESDLFGAVLETSSLYTTT